MEKIIKYINYASNLIANYLKGVLIVNGVTFLFIYQKLNIQEKLLIISLVNTIMMLSYGIDILLYNRRKKMIANIIFIFIFSVILRQGIEYQKFDIFNPNIFFIIFLCNIVVKMASNFLLNTFTDQMTCQNCNQSQGDEQKRKSDSRTEEELAIAAVHEAGHFIVAKLLGFRVDRLTIDPLNNGNGGCISFISPRMVEEGYYKNLIMITYAGTIAEKLVFKTSFPYGRVSDLEQATEIIKKYYSSGETKYGLLNLNQLITDNTEQQLKLYAEISHDLEEETRNILKEYKRMIYYTKDELIQNRDFSGEDKIDELWDRLMTKFTESSAKQPFLGLAWK